MNKPDTPSSLKEIRDLLRELPGPDLGAKRAVETREMALLKPPGALGRLESLAAWLAAWQGREDPHLAKPRIAVFAGNHGVAAQGVSAYPASVTAQMVQAFIAGQGAVNQLSALADADLRIYELALDQPTEDMTQGPAMGEEDAVRAIAYGMMAVEPGFDCMGLGEMGIANTTAAAALAAALFGGSGADWAGPGTGLDREALTRKAAVIDRALAQNAEALGDPLACLAAFGGYEFCAILGAVIACRLARTPVILDGFACSVAASVLHAIRPESMDHCLVAHVSAEPGHRRLLAEIGKQPLLDFSMRLGEASGAALVLPLLKAACACHNGMATFEEAGVG
ncbi:MAG: nicotinate-nucleotide--dimethylbenzimidazole phosphoribosyltransferase [Rhodospirillales bacterium]|nr:nicotinate-nucleotide--dimethylbenzimidazole phosphoribosyltransferase [Rhodospirillales bacterium]